MRERRCLCRGYNVAMGDLVPPDPPLVGSQVQLRPFQVADAAAIAAACRDPDIPRFTMMPEAMTEAQAREWVEHGLAGWPRGLARFAITLPPANVCVGQMGTQFDFGARRAEAFYWLDRRVPRPRHRHRCAQPRRRVGVPGPRGCAGSARDASGQPALTAGRRALRLSARRHSESLGTSQGRTT